MADVRFIDNSDEVLKALGDLNDPPQNGASFNYGQSFRVNSPTREGYKFIGWKNSSTDKNHATVRSKSVVNLLPG